MNDRVSVVGTGLTWVCGIVNSTWQVPSGISSFIVEMGGGSINVVLMEFIEPKAVDGFLWGILLK